MVRQVEGAIGYVELIYALQNNINYGWVKERLRCMAQSDHRRCERRGGQGRNIQPTTGSLSPMPPGKTHIPSPALPGC